MQSIFDDLELPKDFLFQVISLFICILFVHTFYLLFIEPSAAEQFLLAANENRAPDRTLTVILKDFEQEVCIMFFFWALSIIFLKWRDISDQSKLLKINLLDENINEINKEQAINYLEETNKFLLNNPNKILPRCIWSGLNSFIISNEVADAALSTHGTCNNEAERMESELSMIRYIIWAIPSIGFIGTVRGIGEALSQAHLAVEGDIAGMTASLGIAFNSTFVALVISILLMFFLHQLQLVQDRLFLDVHDYCDKKLLSQLIK
tara:strand:- start:181 stop:972 length:792 start_codon:yes stop_codon:yes gene_type:complete